MNMSNTPPLGNVCIIGPGLIGCSIGLALRQSHYTARVSTLGNDENIIQQAIARGGFESGTTNPKEALKDADLIIVATPLSAFKACFKDIYLYAPKTAVVTDTGSTKLNVANWAREVFPTPGDVIGAHPMAGSEKAGPMAARADLFKGKPCILTLTDNDTQSAVDMVKLLWQDALGMTLVTMSPESHDAAVASVSHLPHLSSVALVLTAEKLGGMQVAGNGFGDSTRVAAGNATLWADIFHHNRDAVLHAARVMQQTLSSLIDTLDSQTPQALEQSLEEAAILRKNWEQSK